MTGAPTIVAAGPLGDPAPAILARFGRVVVAERDEPETLHALLGEALGLVARGATRVGPDLLDAAPRLRVIGRNGVGVDAIDLAAATVRGIPVIITPGVNAVAMAEGTIALLLALIKRLPALDRAVRDGRWADRDMLAPGDVAGTTLAVAGYGAIGGRVGEMALALGMHVIACDPALGAGGPARGTGARPAGPAAGELARPTGGAPPAGVEPADLGDAVARADHLSLHVPLTAETRGLVGPDLLARAKSGLNLVNVSRGAVAPLDVLLHGLESGALGGIALDVFDPEPPDPGHPLLARPEVICSPHALSLTPAASRAVLRAMSEGMAAVLDGCRAPAVANPAVYQGEPT